MGELNINILTAHGPYPVRIEIEGESVSSISYTDGNHVDASTLLVPSPVDLHVHLRDFDQSNKETVASGTAAALAGGMCAVADMPNTSPPVADREAYARRKELFERDAACDYLLNFCVFDEFSLSHAASVDPFFIKVYLDETTGSYILPMGLLERVFMLGKPIALHAHFEGVREAVRLSKKYGTRLHVCHVSTKEEVEFLSRNKDGNITCEATPHHLFLSGDYAVKPPLGTDEDRRALISELGKTIDIVASDHAPHSEKDKRKGAYGLAGVETLLPVMATAMLQGDISFEAFYRTVYANPKAMLRSMGYDFGFDVGRRADFAILETGRPRAINPSEFKSKAKHSPFEGYEVEAQVIATWVRGKPFYENGELTRYAKGAPLHKEQRM